MPNQKTLKEIFKDLKKKQIKFNFFKKEEECILIIERGRKKIVFFIPKNLIKHPIFFLDFRRPFILYTLRKFSKKIKKKII